MSVFSELVSVNGCLQVEYLALTIRWQQQCGLAQPNASLYPVSAAIVRRLALVRAIFLSVPASSLFVLHNFPLDLYLSCQRQNR
jgi:hypothetical protein